MNAVSGRITLKNTSLAMFSVFSTVLVTKVEAYLEYNYPVLVLNSYLGFIPLGINCGGGNFDGHYGCVATGRWGMH